MTPLYKTTVTARGGREGLVKCEDGRFEHVLSIPKEIGGAGGEGTNPEQLFAAGYAACFESALRLIARKQKVELKDASVTAHVTLGKTEQGTFGLAVELVGDMPGVPQGTARELMRAAHAVCPYSNATRGNIDVKLDVRS